MKRIVVAAVILLSASVLYAQKKDLKNEIKMSYGIYTIPNGHRMYEEDIWKGGFTVNYMYRVIQWFWVGTNINWQFPSDPEYYSWREYNTDGTFKDFKISKKDNFFAIAPELRFSYTNKERVILYSGLSAGYGIHKGLNKKNLSSDILNDYWYWNITFFGASLSPNVYFAKKNVMR